MKAEEKGIAIFVILAVMLLVLAVASHFTKKQPSHAVTARVVRITTSGAYFPRDIVVAHAPRAMEAQSSVHYPDELRCHVGDDVDGKQTGLALIIDPTTCRRHQISSTSRP